MSNIQGQILERIQCEGKGKVFTGKDFLDRTAALLTAWPARLGLVGVVELIGAIPARLIF